MTDRTDYFADLNRAIESGFDRDSFKRREAERKAEVQRLARSLPIPTNNDLTGLPKLIDDRDVDGNRTGYVNDDVFYLVDVTKLASEKALNICDLAEIAAEAARAEAYSNASDHYRGGNFAEVKITVTVCDGDETVKLDDGKLIVCVKLYLEVDATQPDETPEPEYCGDLRKWV